MPALFTMQQRVRILRRAFEIFLKKGKKIKLLYFNHVPDADSSDTLIIRYRFTNAIYYSVDGNTTFDTRHVLVRPDGTKQIGLTVYGLFRKNHYMITVEPNNIYISKVLQPT